MITKNIKEFKKISYYGLTLFSTVLTLSAPAAGSEQFKREFQDFFTTVKRESQDLLTQAKRGLKDARIFLKREVEDILNEGEEFLNEGKQKLNDSFR